MDTGRDCGTNRACVIPSPCKRDSLETACRSDDPGFKVEAECEETTNATPNENSVSRPPDDLQDEVAITKVMRQTNTTVNGNANQEYGSLSDGITTRSGRVVQSAKLPDYTYY